jgi:hypothetical protein
VVSLLYNGTQIDFSPALFEETNGDKNFKQVFKQQGQMREDDDNNGPGPIVKRNIVEQRESKYFLYFL